MKKFVHALGFAFLACSLTAACGGDDNGGGGGGGAVDSGVPDDKQGQDLTEDEAQKVCDAYSGYAASKLTENDVCRIAGLLGAAFAIGFDPDATDADLKSACEGAVTSCLEEDEEPTEGEDECPEIPAECTATVGEIETCAKDTVDQAVAYFQQIPTCDGMTKAYLESMEESPEQEQPQSCVAVSEKCPGLLD